VFTSLQRRQALAAFEEASSGAAACCDAFLSCVKEDIIAFY
jgi:hypothetical protein